ncbi:DUF2336 domain-containing protein [Brevundimonas lutea]|uniref:DUF2336 domain-containing protein n=1 Tax=Brevundimonas lutea TaxID=2293980 RepID=UPI000F01F6B5|nr:DUF2336 domain-containing protein [Brevundimonas lutea]
MTQTAATVDQASRLPDLIAMAHEGSSETRRALLRELTDHFFGAPVRSQAEDALYGEVMARLATEMEAAVRGELSERFSVSLDAPHALVRTLALDPSPEVANPVLKGSPVLQDADLLEVVARRGQSQLRAVSGRVTVSEAVSDVIVERGDDETLGTLLRNQGAALSRQANETVVSRAQANPGLHAAVVERTSLPPDLLNEMYFIVEARLRRVILERNARMDPAMLDQALSAGRNRVAADDGQLPDDYAEAEVYVRELAAAGQLTPHTLARLLRSGSRTAFLIALADMAEIDFHTAKHIVDRGEIDALAVVCKAANLDRSLFLTYAVVLLAREQDALAKAQSYTSLYNDLQRETAMRTLRFWRLRRQAHEAA